MTLLETAAEAFEVPPESLLHDSLQEYFKQQLVNVEADIFLLAKKYGIKDVFELDARVQEGIIHEAEAHDDYFRLDHLESKRDKIKQILEQL